MSAGSSARTEPGHPFASGEPIVAPYSAHSPATTALPPLRNGDRLRAAEFERRYAAMPDLEKAELIEGIVYVGSAVSPDHGDAHFVLIALLGVYQFATPGIVGSNNASVRLDPDNRAQPDIHLRLRTDYGGQSHLTSDSYLEGAPEFVAEVAYSSVSYDLHDKLQVYRRNGVRDYVVWRVEDRAIDWFVLRETGYERLSPASDGIYRSEVFPGLWLDTAALLRGETQAVVEMIRTGIGSPEHAEFVAKLRAEHERLAAQSPKPRGDQS
jgi:Uma2 family endonuclease